MEDRTVEVMNFQYIAIKYCRFIFVALCEIVRKNKNFTVVRKMLKRYKRKKKHSVIAGNTEIKFCTISRIVLSVRIT